MERIKQILDLGAEYVKEFFKATNPVITIVGGVILLGLFILGFRSKLSQMLFAIVTYGSSALMIYDVTLMAHRHQVAGSLIPEHVIYVAIVYLISFALIWFATTYRITILAYSREGADMTASKFIDFTVLVTVIAVASSVVMLCFGWPYLALCWTVAGGVMLLAYCFATR